MAKKPSDENFEDFDLDDFGGDDAGGDDGLGAMKDDRKAITVVTSSFGKGAKDYLLSPRRQREFIEKSLPPGYSSAFDTVDTGAKFAKELYDTAAEELKPITQSAKSLLNVALPKEGQYKQGGLISKLAGWARDGDTGKMSQDQMDEASVTTGLAAIFKAQAEDQVAKDKHEDGERQVDRAVAMRLQGGSLQQLRQLTHLVGRQVSYQDQILIKFQQKQLELNYRQYFVQRQLLTAFRDHATVAKENLAVISKNTGLPDFVKMRNKEVIEQVMKTSTIAALTEGARGWFKNGTQRLLTHYKTQLREFGSTVGMVMESVQGGVEMTQGVEEMGMSRRNMALEAGGEGLGQYAAGKLADKLSPKLKALAEKNPKAVAWGLRLANMNRGMPQAILDWVRDKSGEDGDGWIDRFLNSTKQGIGDYKQDKAVRVSAADKLDEAVHFNLQARQTLVEVIPGWLSRIHNEQRMMRTGNDKLQPLKYSFESGSFEESGQAYRGVVKRVFKNTEMKKTAAKLEEAMQAFDGADLSAEERAALAKYLFERAESKDVGFSTKNFITDDGFEGMDAGLADTIKTKLRNFTGVNIEQRVDRHGNVKNKAKFDMEGPGQARRSAMMRGFQELQEAMPNFQEVLQKEMTKGNQDALMDLGLIEYDESTSTWNMKVDFFREAVMDTYQGLTDEQKGKQGVWGKVIRDTLNRLQGAIAGKDVRKTNFATGGHVRGPKLRSKFPNQRYEPSFRKTGLLTGPGTGTSDSININASTDEFVVRAATTRQPGMLGFLKDLNQRGTEAIGKWRDKFSSSPQGQDEFVGPIQPESDKPKVRRSLTDLYELVDSWAPIWAAGGTLGGGLNALGRLGTKAKGLFSKLDPRRLKRMGVEIDKEELKRRARQGLSAVERTLLNVKDKAVALAGSAVTGGINGLGKLSRGGKWVKDTLKAGLPVWARGAKAFMDHRSAAFKDIYVQGEEEPRMEAERMRAGDYRDRKTGKIIKRLSDITGPVDDVHTGKVVISKVNFKKGLYDKFGKPLALRMADKVKQLTSPLTKVLAFSKGIGRGIFRRLDAWEDVYVKGETEPRLYARLLAEGKYFDKKTRKPVYHVKNITGPVVDEHGAVVLNARDLKKGLVNQSGKPITSLMQRVKGAAMGGLDMALGMGTRAAGFVWDQASKVGGLLMKLGAKAKGLPDKLKGMKFNLGFGVMINRPVVSKLEEIRLMLDERLKKPKKRASNDTDGDGSRDGSAAEQKEAAAAEESQKQQGRMATLLEKLSGVKNKVKEKVTAGGDGIMGLFSGLKDLLGNMGSMFSGFTEFLPAATTMATVISKIKGLPGGIVEGLSKAKGIGGKAIDAGKNLLGKGGALRTGAQMLGRGLLSVGRFALGGTGTLIRGGMMLGGAILSSPVLLAAAVVGAAYGAYKLYQYATKEDDYVMRWRMAQYGVDPDEDELVQKILNAEGLLLKNIKAPKGSPASFGTGVKFGQLMSIFGVKEENQEHMERFMGWFQYRFKPIFLSTVSIFRDITIDKTNILNADQVLTADQAKDLVKKTHFPAGSPQSPYQWAGLPFTDEEETDLDEEDINDLLEDTLEDIEDDRERYDKNSQVNKKRADTDLKADRDKKQKDKDDTLWNRTANGAKDMWQSTKSGAAAAWAATKDSAAAAMEKVKSWGKAGMDWGGKALNTASKMGKEAWSWMKDSASAAGGAIASAGGGVVQGALDLAKLVGGKVGAAFNKVDSNQLYQSVLKYAKYAGVTTPAGLAMYLGQMYEETGGFKVVSENLNYKTDTMMKLFSRAKNAGRAAVDQVAKAGPVAVAEFLYGGRMGNDQPGDGWKYRGRGPLQLTGKGNYAAAAKALGIDLVNNPDLMLDNDIGAKVSAWYFKSRVNEKALNAGDLRTVTKQVNGGYINISNRANDVANFLGRIKDGTLNMLDMERAASKATPDARPAVTAPPLPGAPKTPATAPVGGSTANVTAPSASAAADSTVAKHKEAQVQAGASAGASTKAAAAAATSTDSIIKAGMDALLKVNQDMLVSLQSIDAKMDRFVAEGPASPPSAGSSAVPTTPSSRKGTVPPVKMGSR